MYDVDHGIVYHPCVSGSAQYLENSQILKNK